MNHYLLMADLVVRKEMKGYDTVAILPPFKKIIIDEAHRLEAVATANLGYTISKLRIIKLLGRLINLKDNRKGLLQYLKNKLRDVSSAHDKSIAAKDYRYDQYRNSGCTTASLRDRPDDF